MKPVRWEEIAVEQIAQGVQRQVVWGEKGTLARFRFAKDAHVSPHKHEGEQHTWLVEGGMRVRMAGGDILLRSGDVLVIPSWEEHEVWFLEDSIVVDFFSPARTDWLKEKPAYLAGK